MSDELAKDFLEELYEDAPCGYIFTFIDGTIERVNRTFTAWTGYTLDDLAEIRFQDLLTTPSTIFFENQFAPLLWMQGFVKEVSLDLRCKDGSRLPVLVNSNLRAGEAGEPVLVASTMFDMTDRQRYEHELRIARQRAEQLATIVRSATDAILATTPDGVIETWNVGAERLFGYKAGDIIGRRLWMVLPALEHDDESKRILGELQAGRAVYLDTRGRQANEGDIDVSVGLMPQLGLLGELEAVSAIIRDISERRAVERLQQEFLAMTSHELRQPLTIITVQAQLMKRRESYNERDADTLIHQAEHLGRLIDDLLLASVIDADRFDLRPKPIDLLAEVRIAVGQHAAGAHPIRLDIPDTPLVVLGDAQRLGQVFTNLLTNAAKYSPEGREIVVRARRDASTVKVDVSDEGIGIAPEAMPRLFTRFFRVKGPDDTVPGLGLGLFITDSIVRAHEGSIEVQSEVGVGSTFTVILPLYEDPDG